MDYREIAARQRGFLLRSQLTEEEKSRKHAKPGLSLMSIYCIPSKLLKPSSADTQPAIPTTGHGY